MTERAVVTPMQPDAQEVGRRASILLVDDNDGNLAALEAILKDLGQDLVRARSGQEALRLLLDRTFAVILLDVRMPDMDGFETAELVRKRRNSRHTPIIFITAADAFPDQITRGYSVGAVDYIFKPFMPEVLKAKVRIFLDLFNKTEEIWQNEVRLRTLIANVPGAVYRRAAAPPWNMLFLSDAIEMLCGYPAADFTEGRRVFGSIIHPGDMPTVSQELLKAVRTMAPYALEYRVVHRDGRVRWILDRGQSLDERGTSRHMDGVLLEITSRKVAEEALSELVGRLLQMQDDERRRIAHDLHDNTSPLLTGLIGKLYSIRHRTASPDPATARLLDDSLKLAEQTSGIIRNVSHLLYPRLLDETSLLASVRWFVNAFTDRTGIPVVMNLPDELMRLPRDTEIALFRVVQESLTNVLRHSGSAVATVRVCLEPQQLFLEVSDRGRPGLLPPVASSGREPAVAVGVSMAGMRERIRRLGGSLQVLSGDAGTTVTVTLPIEAAKP
jgi:PAS domain S-box-containing protein